MAVYPRSVSELSTVGQRSINIYLAATRILHSSVVSTKKVAFPASLCLHSRSVQFLEASVKYIAGKAWGRKNGLNEVKSCEMSVYKCLDEYLRVVAAF